VTPRKKREEINNNKGKIDISLCLSVEGETGTKKRVTAVKLSEGGIVSISEKKNNPRRGVVSEKARPSKKRI